MLLAQIARDQHVRELAADRVGLAIAEYPFGGRVEIGDDAALVHRHGGVERAIQDGAHLPAFLTGRVLEPLTVNELPDLIADRRHRIEEIGVARDNAMREELDHAEYLVLEANRKAE